MLAHNIVIEVVQISQFFKKSVLHQVFLYLILASVFVLVFLKKDQISTIILPFAIGIFISYILDPIVSFLLDKGFDRTFAICLIYFILTASIIISILYILPIVITELNYLICIMPEYSLKIEQLLETFNLNYKYILPVGVQEAIDNTISTLENKTIRAIQNLANNIMWLFKRLFSFILGPVLGFYILKDKDKIKQKVTSFLPLKYQRKFFYWSNKIDVTLGHYVRSQLIISCIIGVLTTIALYFLRVDFALLIGIIAGITNIIPYFGPIIGGLPAIFIALLKYPKKILWIIIALLVIQEFESGIISPYIMGQTIGLHPLTVIFALLTGGTFFGFWGLLLAVPVTALLKIIILDSLENSS